MDKHQIITKTKKHVKNILYGEGSGHDWWHIYRVWQSSINIAKNEGGDLLVIELAALLHDISDWKFTKDHDDSVGPQIAYDWVKGELGLSEDIALHVKDIVATISFKGAKTATPMKTVEGAIVQDADRLDAIGTVGIGRAFAYGGFKKQEMHSPDIKPVKHVSFDDYKKNPSTTVNHFYEKLLLLTERMNTAAGKRLAERRHEFMKSFLDEFFAEWEGKS